MSKGDKNTRVKNWQKYWTEYDQIFKKEKQTDTESPNIYGKEVRCIICKKVESIFDEVFRYMKMTNGGEYYHEYCAIKLYNEDFINKK